MTEKTSNEFVNTTANKDVADVLAQKTTIIEKGKKLGKVFEIIGTLLQMIRDYINGDYRKVPWSTIAKAAAALLYLASPIDAIPDPLPVVGLSDDALVIMAVISSISDDLTAYRKWRATKKNSDCIRASRTAST